MTYEAVFFFVKNFYGLEYKKMVILDDEEYNKVWDIVYDRFNFNPSVDKKEIAFEFKEQYIVYYIIYHYENL